jgi:hypothetical protein
MVELAMLLDELGYAIAATPFLSTAVAAAVLQRPAATSSGRGGCRRWRPARRPARSAPHATAWASSWPTRTPRR